MWHKCFLQRLRQSEKLQMAVPWKHAPPCPVWEQFHHFSDNCVTPLQHLAGERISQEETCEGLMGLLKTERGKRNGCCPKPKGPQYHRHPLTSLFLSLHHCNDPVTPFQLTLKHNNWVIMWRHDYCSLHRMAAFSQVAHCHFVVWQDQFILNMAAGPECLKHSIHMRNTLGFQLVY